MSEPLPVPLEIWLIDGFQLRHFGLPVILPSPAERLLAFLALRERPVARSWAAFTLWADVTEQRAAGSLRSALWSLRRSGLVLVETKGESIQLAPDIPVDFREGVRAAERLMRESADTDSEGIHPRPLFGELLPGWYDEWVLTERRRFDDIRVRALETLCELHRRAGRLKLAVDAGLAAVNAEPLRESCRRSLMRAHLAEGNYADAHAQYFQFSNLLRTQLGLEPSAQMAELIETLKPSRRSASSSSLAAVDGSLTLE